ncbi:Gfo/Idh/MocA family protein [Lacimicrobium alkaliphilum]|uniref:Oxidoreductase n=1 Tax=Lacimicrobium alkaliphilum TaxID=1526571 RepID=A0A0U2QQC0_9ALTE|nr:Gfo/Idh/MocA family oxidoreductase [Lacimicrobium alkaliphilum]ALS99915.1 oxidoreductase [Lacimicrobium alkaliphilum]
MQLNSTINWGIIGAGRIARTFARDMAFVPHSRILAVASRQLSDAAKFAREHNITEAIEGYQALFEHTDIDAIYIATPHNFHFEQTKAALQAGKHVLCEKPITISTAQCIELSGLAKARNCFLMEAMWTWFLPAIRKAKQWVDEGRIGRLLHVKGDFGYPQPYDPDARTYNPALAGGALLDMGIYPLALNLLFNPQPYQSLRVKAHQAPSGVDDEVHWTMDYGDRISTLATSFRCRLPNYGFIIGDQGYIAIPDFFRASEASLYVLDERVDHFRDNRQGSGFEFEIMAASQAIREGKPESDIMPLSASLILQQQMEAILKRIREVPLS